MAWVFHCAKENIDLVADTRERLAEKVMQHMKDRHDTQISLQQAMDMVSKDARQQAA
jgi:hypothetical protein